MEAYEYTEGDMADAEQRAYRRGYRDGHADAEWEHRSALDMLQVLEDELASAEERIAELTRIASV